MRSLILFILLFISSVHTFAQSRNKISFSGSLNPSVFFPVNVSSSSDKVSGNPNQTYKEYADSVRTFETFKFSAGATVWVNYLLNQKWTLQAGVGFNETGFTRKQKDIKFNDILFPGVGGGKLIENSNTVKNIDYKFRYQYLTVPILFNYYGKRSRDFKWTYYFSTGVGLNVLLKHEVKAVLDQFVMDGESKFHLDSTGYEGRTFAVNLFVGGRFEYKIDKNMSVFGQPLLTVYPVSISKTPMNVYPIGITMNCGVVYVFDKAKDEK
jgi:hypothetical protein